MNKQDPKLKTIQSQIQNQSTHIVDSNKFKNQSTHKISLKQSSLKQPKQLCPPQLNSKSKKNHQISIENDHRYKIVKELQSFAKHDDENKKYRKYSNILKDNKSLVFAQQKLRNPRSDTLKSSKLNVNEIKGGEIGKKQKEQIYNYKKGFQKGSTAKKHSKSVYNYTEFDDYPQQKQTNKKNNTKQNQIHNSRYYHNKSSFAQQGHHLSTSSMTKRVNKPKQILNRLLNNSDIKKKTKHFKILSNCLRQYLKGEEILDNKIDVLQIIKLVKAFNTTEISKLSKPLEQLITQIIQFIRQTVNREKETEQKQNKIIHKFQTPQRQCLKLNKFLSKSKRSSITGQNPTDISKTKKFYPNDNDDSNEKPDQGAQQNSQNSLSKDLSIMKHGLEELRSESKQLKKFIHESSSKRSAIDSEFEKNQKRHQIDQLKQILWQQKQLLEHFQNYGERQQDKSAVESFLRHQPPLEDR